MIELPALEQVLAALREIGVGNSQEDGACLKRFPDSKSTAPVARVQAAFEEILSFDASFSELHPTMPVHVSDLHVVQGMDGR